MEEDDDDFYGGGGVKEEAQMDEDDKDEKMDVSEDEDDSSEDDVQFITEKPEGAKTEPSSNTKQQSKATPATDSKPAKTSGTPIKSERARTGSAAPTTAPVRGTLTHNGKEGKDFPEHRTSKLDVNAIPTWPSANKPITEVDIDADLAENSKPWRLPGTDITDFFNYGFDEYAWTQYCLRQQEMSNTISEQKQKDAQMKAMFGGGMPPGMPGGMEGMPDPSQFFQMMQSGQMPADMASFMGMNPGMGGQGQFGGQGQQGGGFGSGQNSASPHPQPGQGFQPPSGPSGGGQQGGFQGGNMEGYSQQQIAMLQEQQGGGFQGGGGGRGRGKRRGGGW